MTRLYRTDRLDSMSAFRRAAHEVDDLHRAGMRSLPDELAEVHLGETGRRLAAGRRRFLQQVGLGGVALTLGSSLLPASRLLPAAWGQEDEEGAPLDDLTIAIFAEQVELAAAAAYQVAAETGLLDATAVEVGTLFAEHHADHAGAFAALAGDQATGVPNDALLDAFGPMIIEAADQGEILDVAFQLEQGAASTYHFALGVLGADAAAVVSTIMPIEAQHAVVLGGVLGKDIADYMPPFETSETALSPDAYPLSDLPDGGGDGATDTTGSTDTTTAETTGTTAGEGE